MKTIEVHANVTAAEVTKRVAEVKEYERFSVFRFTIKSEHHFEQIVSADSVMVTTPEGVYIGYVEDYDDATYYVNLR